MKSYDGDLPLADLILNAKLLYDRAIREKITCLSRLDSYRNWGLTTVTFTFTAYAYMMGQKIDPAWRFVLLNVSFILVFHFLMLETINTIYIWNYNDVIGKIQDLLLSGGLKKEELSELYERTNNVRRTRCLQYTLVERARTPLFSFLVVVLIVWMFELIQGISTPLSITAYIGILVLYGLWWVYEILNILTYPLFKYREPMNQKDRSL